MPKMASFWKPEACGQAELPDRFLLWQKLVERAKVKNLKYDILGDFQTLCFRTEYQSFVKIELLDKK